MRPWLDCLGSRSILLAASATLGILGCDPQADSELAEDSAVGKSDEANGDLDVGSEPLNLEAQRVLADLGAFEESFCTDDRQNADARDAYGTNLANAAWLAAFSSNAYASFAEQARFYGELGFGNPQFEALEFVDGTFVRTGEIVDEAQWWAEQFASLKRLDEQADPAGPAFKQALLQRARAGQDLQFFTAGRPTTVGFSNGSTQVTFARHRASNTVIVAF